MPLRPETAKRFENVLISLKMGEKYGPEPARGRWIPPGGRGAEAQPNEIDRIIAEQNEKKIDAETQRRGDAGGQATDRLKQRREGMILANPGLYKDISGMFDRGESPEIVDAVVKDRKPGYSPEEDVDREIYGSPLPLLTPEDEYQHATVQVTGRRGRSGSYYGELSGASPAGLFPEIKRDIHGPPKPLMQEGMGEGRERLSVTHELDWIDKINELGQDPLQVVPFISGAKEIQDVARVAMAARRMEQNEETPADLELLREYVERAGKKRDFWYQVVDVLSRLPAFAGEIYLTAGVYTATKKATVGAASSALKKLLSEGGEKLLEKKAAQVALQSAGGIVGATAQTVPAGAARIAAGTIKRMTPGIQLGEDDAGEVGLMVSQEGEKILPAFAKALGDQWIEILSERSGGLFNVIGGAAKEAAIKHGILASFLKLNPDKTVGSFKKIVERAGWNGVASEILEERAGDIGRAALGLEDWKLPSAEQLAVELVSFSIPGVAIGLADRTDAETKRKGDAERKRQILNEILDIEQGERSRQERQRGIDAETRRIRDAGREEAKNRESREQKRQRIIEDMNKGENESAYLTFDEQRTALQELGYPDDVIVKMSGEERRARVIEGAEYRGQTTDRSTDRGTEGQNREKDAETRRRGEQAVDQEAKTLPRKKRFIESMEKKGLLKKDAERGGEGDTEKEPGYPPETAGRTQEIKTQNRAKATGGTGKAKTERGTEIEFEYAVYDANDLVSSHDVNLVPDTRYPKELQPRDRTKAASDVQIRKIENNLTPERLGENIMASEGAPIVDPAGNVESGNARVIALKRLFNHRDAENAEKYRGWLKANAEKFGINLKDLEGMAAPVLVRRRTGEPLKSGKPINVRAFVEEANVQSTAAMSAGEQATADAGKLDAELMELFVPNEEGDLSLADNSRFRLGFFKRVGITEMGRYTDRKGNISQEGITRIRNAIFASAYGSPMAIERLAESTDNNIKNITNSMLSIAPKVVSLKEKISKGIRHDLDISGDIAAAAEKLADLRSNGQHVRDYLQQGTLFGEDLSPLAKDVLSAFETFKRSGKALTQVFDNYIHLVDRLGDPNQTDLFAQKKTPTREEIFRAALKQGERRADPNIFESEAGGGAKPGAAVTADGAGGQAQGGRGKEDKRGKEELGEAPRVPDLSAERRRPFQSAEKENVSKAATDISTALKETAKGINEIFGGKRIGVKAGFTEEDYRQAKPHFDRAWEAYKNAKKTLLQYVTDLMKTLDGKIRKLVDRWRSEVLRAKDSELGVLNVMKAIKEGGANKQERTARKVVAAGWTSKAMAPISTRLEQIFPGLKYSKISGLRTFEFNLGQAIQKDTKEVLPLMDATKKMPTADRKAFDLAQKNGRKRTMNDLAAKYGFTEELERARAYFEEVYQRAKDAGYDLGYLGNYFPRRIKDYKKYLQYVQGLDSWGEISQAIKERNAQRAANGKPPLTEQEKAAVANAVIRGFQKAKRIGLGPTSNMKEREIDEVDEESNEHYYDINASMLYYIESVNKAIEGRKYFGQGKNGRGDAETQRRGEQEKKGQVKLFDQAQMDDEMTNSIGWFVSNLIDEGHVKPEHEQTLVDIFQARFGYRYTGSTAGVIKNIGYATSMGSVSSAVTQFGDLAFAMYNAGIYRSAKAYARAVAGYSKISREDIGIERIAEEFRDPTKFARALQHTFKWTGLTGMDRLGKETLINATIDKMQAEARRGKLSEKTEKMIRGIFGEEYESVVEELRRGGAEVSDNVKLLAFNTLLDFQPVALSEMPELYLKHPGGRIFYMLKTFTIKQLDIFRREAIWKIRNGATIKEKMQGAANMARLGAMFMLANAGADEIKDWLFNRHTDMEDRVVDNFLRLFGLSKYAIYKFRRENVTGMLWSMIRPPADFIELPTKDISEFIDAWKKGELRDWHIKDMQSWKMIPHFGKLYYWWFGRGAEWEKDDKLKERKRKRRKLEKLLKSLQ